MTLFVFHLSYTCSGCAVRCGEWGGAGGAVSPTKINEGFLGSNLPFVTSGDQSSGEGVSAFGRSPSLPPLTHFILGILRSTVHEDATSFDVALPVGLWRPDGAGSAPKRYSVRHHLPGYLFIRSLVPSCGYPRMLQILFVAMLENSGCFHHFSR